jgi:hypothetical protein
MSENIVDFVKEKRKREKAKTINALDEFQEKVHYHFYNEFSEEQRKENRKGYRNIQRFIEKLKEKEENDSV